MTAQAYYISPVSTPFASFIRVAASLLAVAAFGLGMADMVVRPGTVLGDALATVGLGVSDAPAAMLLEAGIYGLALLPITAVVIAMVTSWSTLVYLVQERLDLAISAMGALASVLCFLVYVDGLDVYPLYAVAVYAGSMLFARLLAGDW